MAGTFIEFLKPHEQELKKRIKKKGLTVTVSGSSKSGKTTGAKAIAKALKLRYVSSGKIFRMLAKKHRMPLEEFSRRRKKEVDYEIDKKNLEYAMRGGYVIDGRLSGMAAGSWANVRIFYYCPLPKKAKRFAEVEGISFEKAKKIISERDTEDNKKYRNLYNIDLFDQKNYHIIVDNGKLTLDQNKKIPVELVKEFLKRKKSSSA